MYLGLIITYILVNCNGNEDTIGYGGMVSSTSDLASLAGRKILAKGGTAADAAVAVQMVLTLVGPFASGIGGGAFIMYYDAENKVVRALDGREEAPTSFNPFVFCNETSCFDSNGTSGDCDSCIPIPFAERRTGGLSVGVPGTVYAMKRLYELYGIGDNVVSWSELFEDAIYYAKNGFTAYQTFVDDIKDYIPYLGRFESSCKLLLNYPICNESKFQVGDTITNTDLAQTFMILADLGPDGAVQEFYNGEMADAIVNTSRTAINPVTQRGGEIAREDLAKYLPVFREPITSTMSFNDKEYTFYGMNMPSSGPLTVQYALKLIEFMQTENDDADEFNTEPYSADALHYMFSAGNIAFADRNQYMADQDFVNVPVDGMLKDDYLEERARDYLTNMAQDLPIPYGEPDGFNDSFPESTVNEQGTAHFCIVDRFGNVASITTTIEGKWGSMVVVDGYGFFLNNELTDFSAPGIVDGEKVANAPEGGKKARISAIDPFDEGDNESIGGKRPRSSMSPMIVLSDGSPYIAIGGRGGPTIIGTVISVLIRNLIYGMSAQEAINSPRVYGMNGLVSTNLVTFEKNLWEQYNMNLTSKMVSKFGYNGNYLFNLVFGSGNMIIVGNDNLLYCGVDTSRLETEACSAVCNSSDSSCIFSMTTMYPETTGGRITPTILDANSSMIIRLSDGVIIGIICMLLYLL